MDAIKIGKAIKMLRKKNGMTQAELAKRMNVTDKAVSKWERGLGVPDISLITKLAFALDADVDYLLEGNVSFLNHSWKGILKIDDYDVGCSVYGKPCVYFPICYFVLAGIRNIIIVSNEESEKFIQHDLEDVSRLGLNITYERKMNFLCRNWHNVMIIYGLPFIYGNNLTRYFQRAMADNKNVTILSIPYRKGNENRKITIDSCGFAHKVRKSNTFQYLIPIVFIHDIDEYMENSVDNCDDLIELLLEKHNLGVKQFGNGMIYRELKNSDDLLDVSIFIRLMEDTSGCNVYCIEEIAIKREMVEREEMPSGLEL